MKRIPFQSSAVKSTVKGVLLGSTLALPLMAASLPAAAADSAADVQELKAQLQELQSKVASLEVDQNTARKSDDFFSISKGGLSVGNTTAKISGYVRLNASYDINQSLNGGDAGSAGGFSPAWAASGYDPEDGHFQMGANESRLHITTNTSTSMGDIEGNFEGDFTGGGGGNNFHLRIASFTWNNWTFGQDWGTFVDFNYGTTLDFYGPEGETFARHPLIRYAMPLSDTSKLEIALEDPVGVGGADSLAPNSHDHNQLPDLAGRYTTSLGSLSLTAAGIVRQLKVESYNVAGDTDSVVGWGVDLGGSYSLPTGTTLMLTGTYGQGQGSYTYSPGVDVYVDNNGDLKAATKYTGIATISQKLTSTLTTNLVYGIGQLGGEAAQYWGVKRAENAHVNLLYTPTDALMFGVEYIYVHGMLDNGDTGHGSRVQLAAQYSF